MTTSQILDQARAVGITLMVKDGRLVAKGSGPVDPALLAELRSRREEILIMLPAPLGEQSESSEQCEECPQRYGTAPTTSLPLSPVPPRLAVKEATLLVDHVLRQSGGGPGPVLDWVMRQANRYWEAFEPRWSHEHCDHAAALDLLIWQRGSRIKSPTRDGAVREVMKLLGGLEAVAASLKDFPAHQPPGGGITA